MRFSITFPMPTAVSSSSTVWYLTASARPTRSTIASTQGGDTGAMSGTIRSPSGTTFDITSWTSPTFKPTVAYITRTITSTRTFLFTCHATIAFLTDADEQTILCLLGITVFTFRLACSAHPTLITSTERLV